jgi:hypothetical protein
MFNIQLCKASSGQIPAPQENAFITGAMKKRRYHNTSAVTPTDFCSGMLHVHPRQRAGSISAQAPTLISPSVPNQAHCLIKIDDQFQAKATSWLV